MSVAPSKCSTCSAPIYWVRLGEKSIPIDATPASNGTIAVCAEDDRGETVLRGRAVSRAAPALPGEILYINHFATCPQAAQHRRAQQPSPPPASPPAPSTRKIRLGRISDAKRIVEETGAPWAIVIYPGETGRLEGVSWGEREASGKAAAGLVDTLCVVAETLLAGVRR